MKELSGEYHEDVNKLLSLVSHKDDQITYLWSLLDDISTAGDMFKPEINGYFKFVNKKCEERSAVAESLDGQTLTIYEI